MSDTMMPERKGVDKLRTARPEAHAKDERVKKFEPYRPLGSQEIPEKVVEDFRSRGYDLRWVRITTRGQVDLENLAKTTHKGFEPVTIDELPENIAATFKQNDVAGFKGLITSKDTALFKILSSRAREVRKYAEDIANNQIANSHKFIRESGAGGVINESKTRVLTGKNAVKTAFQADDANSEDE